MKEKFLALVEEVKKADIATALRATTNASEFNAVEQKFSEDYKELLEKIAAWAEEFKNSESGAIFNEGETIEDPMEIVIILRIINDEDAVSECEIFERYDDLIDAIRDIGDDFSTAVADFADCDYFCNITAEDIFGADEDGEAESEDDEEDADCGEESDAEEADSDDAECDAAEADDAEESGDENQEEAEPDESNDDGEAEPEDGQEDADCGDADEADSGINLAETE